MLTRLSNAVYEQARAGNLQISSFPNFDPVLNALRNGSATDTAKSYRVSSQRHDQLLVLESMAKKWLEDPEFEQQARDVITAHNDEFNASGEFVLAAERYGWNKTGHMASHLLVATLQFSK